MTEQELLAKIEELQREREWTHQQHRRWGEEREALVREVVALRAKDDGYVQLEARNAELEKAVVWFEQEQQAWQEERRRLVDAVHRMSVKGRLQTVRAWLLHPVSKWKARKRW